MFTGKRPHWEEITLRWFIKSRANKLLFFFFFLRSFPLALLLKYLLTIKTQWKFASAENSEPLDTWGKHEHENRMWYRFTVQDVQHWKHIKWTLVLFWLNLLDLGVKLLSPRLLDFQNQIFFFSSEYSTGKAFFFCLSLNVYWHQHSAENSNFTSCHCVFPELQNDIR